MSEIKVGDTVRYIGGFWDDDTKPRIGIVDRIMGAGTELPFAHVMFDDELLSYSLQSLELVNVAASDEPTNNPATNWIKKSDEDVRAEVEAGWQAAEDFISVSPAQIRVMSHLNEQQAAEIERLQADNSVLTTRNRALVDAVTFAVDALDGLGPLDALTRLYALKRKVDALK